MELYEAEERMYDIAEELIDSMTKIKPVECGLDARSGYRLYISEEAIAVLKSGVGPLDYYGGFEYVGADDKCEIGGYVFYKADSDRIRDHIDMWKGEWKVDDDD